MSGRRIYRDEAKDAYAFVDIAQSGRLDVVFMEKTDSTAKRAKFIFTFFWFRAIADEIERAER